MPNCYGQSCGGIVFPVNNACIEEKMQLLIDAPVEEHNGATVLGQSADLSMRLPFQTWPCSWDSTAQMFKLEASVSRIIVPSASAYARIDAGVKAFLGAPKATSCSAPQYVTPLRVKLCKDREISAKP